MSLLRAVHIAAGAVALIVLWIPIVAKKGGRVHRRAGWVYASAMWIAALSAWGICGLRLADDDPTNDAAALFLAFVGLVVANGVGTGIRVLRTKSRTTANHNPIDVGSAGLLLASSVALGGFGVLHRSILFLAFAGLGLLRSVGQLRFWLRPPATAKEWWFEHMGNMLAAGIGAVTAFLVVNVPRLGLKHYALFFWLAPGVVGGFGIVLWQRYYRRKFAAARA